MHIFSWIQPQILNPASRLFPTGPQPSLMFSKHSPPHRDHPWELRTMHHAGSCLCFLVSTVLIPASLVSVTSLSPNTDTTGVAAKEQSMTLSLPVTCSHLVCCNFSKWHRNKRRYERIRHGGMWDLTEALFWALGTQLRLVLVAAAQDGPVSCLDHYYCKTVIVPPAPGPFEIALISLFPKPSPPEICGISEPFLSLAKSPSVAATKHSKFVLNLWKLVSQAFSDTGEPNQIFSSLWNMPVTMWGTWKNRAN